MRGWALLLGGLIVWTVHFFSIYVIASIFLTTPTARLLALVATLACLIADALVLHRAAQARRRTQDPAIRWMHTLALLGAALSLIAVLWQGLPALLI